MMCKVDIPNKKLAVFISKLLSAASSCPEHFWLLKVKYKKKFLAKSFIHFDSNTQIGFDTNHHYIK